MHSGVSSRVIQGKATRLPSTPTTDSSPKQAAAKGARPTAVMTWVRMDRHASCGQAPIA